MRQLKFDFSKLEYVSKKLTSPSAFSVYATVGVIATTVLAIVCTRKQCEIENEKNSRNDIFEKEPTRAEVIEEVKETAKVYAPMLVSAAVTMLCIRKSDQKWRNCNSIINASYVAARDKMARYRSLASAAVGSEVVKGLNGQKSEPGVEWFCIKDCPVDCGETKDIYFQSTKADVIEAEYHVNRNFQIRGSASVREFFAFLGILDQFPEYYGDALGWDVGIMLEEWEIDPWIDFEHWHVKDESTNEIINIIAFTWEPQFTENFDPLAWGYGEGCGIPYTGNGFIVGPKE